jgi:hypothetical protein
MKQKSKDGWVIVGILAAVLSPFVAVIILVVIVFHFIIKFW